MPVRDDTRDAQESEQLDDIDAGESHPPSMSGDASDSSPSDESRSRPRLSKEERDRRAAEGRRNQVITRLDGQVSNLTTQLGQLATQLSADDKRRQQQEAANVERYLRSLPPEQRAIKEVEMLKGQIAAISSRPMAPPPNAPAPPSAPPAGGETPEEYQQRRMGEILDEAEERYGVRLTGKEKALNNSSALANESSFVGAVHAYAQAIADKGDIVDTLSQERTPERSRDFEEVVADRVARELGFSRPNSPRSAPSIRRGAVTSEHFQDVMQGYKAKYGPRATLKELKSLRDKAEAQVVSPRRGGPR